MHMVEVSQDGVELGTIRFRGLSKPPVGAAPRRRYKCTPKDCVPKLIARKIADRLAFGITAGHEEAYACANRLKASRALATLGRRGRELPPCARLTPVSRARLLLQIDGPVGAVDEGFPALVLRVVELDRE